MSKIEEKKLEKYRSLLDAAYELSAHKELMTVSIDEIVKSAGVAKGTFYLYFKDKYDLISKLILDRVSSFMNEENISDSGLESISGIQAHISLLVTETAKFLKKNMTLTRLIDKNVHICVNAVIENRTGAFKKRYDLIRAELLSQGLGEEEADAKLYLFLDMIVSSCCNALIRKTPLSLDKVCSELTDIITCYYSGVITREKTEVAV